MTAPLSCQCPAQRLRSLDQLGPTPRNPADADSAGWTKDPATGPMNRGGAVARHDPCRAARGQRASGRDRRSRERSHSGDTGPAATLKHGAGVATQENGRRTLVPLLTSGNSSELRPIPRYSETHKVTWRTLSALLCKQGVVGSSPIVSPGSICEHQQHVAFLRNTCRCRGTPPVTRAQDVPYADGSPASTPQRRRSVDVDPTQAGELAPSGGRRQPGGFR